MGYDYVTDDNSRELRNSRLFALKQSTNKLTSGAFTGISIIDNMLMSSVKKMRKAMKRHFGLELSIYPDSIPPKVINALYEWMQKYNNNISTILQREKKMTNETDVRLANMSFYLHLDVGTYAIVKIGDDYKDLLLSDGGLKVMLNSRTVSDNDIYMYIFGKYTYKYHRQVMSIIHARESDSFRMYNIHGDTSKNSDIAFKSLYQDVANRSMDTIFMEPGVIESITDHIDKYLANKDMYSGRGIIYKTGILLYGEPGTGKTSLIKALASKYDYDLILIDMTTFNNIALDTFTHSINIDDKKYIIALEDIDCVIADRENSDADKEDKQIINKLLQFLDSNSSPNEVIFIASTNHVELLDEALMREGRFDLKVEIGGIKEAKVREMCKSFDLSDHVIDTIVDDIKASGIDLKTKTIRQSKLQSMILKYSGMNLRSEEDEEEGVTDEQQH